MINAHGYSMVVKLLTNKITLIVKKAVTCPKRYSVTCGGDILGALMVFSERLKSKVTQRKKRQDCLKFYVKIHI